MTRSKPLTWVLLKMMPVDGHHDTFKTTHLGPVEDDAGGWLELTEVQSTIQHRLVWHHPGWFHSTVGTDDHLGLEPGRNLVCQMSTAKQMKMLVTSGLAASIYRARQKYP